MGGGPEEAQAATQGAEFLRALVESAPDALVVARPDGRFALGGVRILGPCWRTLNQAPS